MARPHVGVAKQVRLGGKALELMAAGLVDALTDLRRADCGGLAAQLLVFDRWHFDVDIDAVEQRARDAGPVAPDRRRRTRAFVLRIGEVAAGAGIHGGDEHEAGRVGQRDQGAGQGDGVVFEGLAQGFDDVGFEFGQLIEEEHAVVGQGDFAGARVGTAADEAGIGYGVLCGGSIGVFFLEISSSTLTNRLPSLIV